MLHTSSRDDILFRVPKAAEPFVARLRFWRANAPVGKITENTEMTWRSKLRDQSNLIRLPALPTIPNLSAAAPQNIRPATILHCTHLHLFQKI